jgi:homoserine O-acetyltransferase
MIGRLFATAAALILALPAVAYDGIVQKQSFTMKEPLKTVGGKTIKTVKIGWEAIGKLTDAKDNVILIPHFYSGNSHFAGKYKAEDAAPGYWDAIVGPGKALDTDKYYLIGVDSLANLNTKDGITVTTGPASIDPETGKPYGMSFPVVQMRDFVNVQKALLDSLGITKLYAVMGASMGAIQAWEWAASYPDMVPRLVSVIGTPGGNAYAIDVIRDWADPIRVDPKWNNGDYYGKEEPIAGLAMALQLLNIDARATVSLDSFARKWADPAKNPADAIDNLYAAQKWNADAALARAKTTDANSVIYLSKANELFVLGGKETVEEGLKLVKAKALLLPSANDRLLPPEMSRQARDILKAQGNKVEYAEIEGPLGHLNGIAFIAKVEPQIKAFLGE